MIRIKTGGKNQFLGESPRVADMYKEIDKYGDVVFVVSQHRIYACRYVISGVSEKFRKVVYELHPNIEEIVISDWKNPIIFRFLVEFCMTGGVECSFSEAVNLLYLANDYEVNDLKKPIEEEILRMISEENCLDTFRIAKSLGIESIARRCHLFFKSDPFKVVLNQPSVRLLSKEAFEDVLLITNFSSKRSKGDEFSLFSSIVEWSKKNAHSDEAEGYKRLANELILKYVNFRNLEPSDIVKIVSLQIMNPMHLIIIQNHCQDTSIDISSIVPTECAVLQTLNYEGRSMGRSTASPRVEEEEEDEGEMDTSEAERRIKEREQRIAAEIQRRKVFEVYKTDSQKIGMDGIRRRVKYAIQQNRIRLKYCTQADILFVVSNDGSRCLDLVRVTIPWVFKEIAKNAEAGDYNITKVRFGLIEVGEVNCRSYLFKDPKSLVRAITLIHRSGGINTVCNQYKALELVGGMNWDPKYPTRCVFHLTPENCYGDPAKRGVEELMLNIRKRKVHYHFMLAKKGGNVNVLNNRMWSQFADYYNTNVGKSEKGVKFNAYELKSRSFPYNVVEFVKKAVKTEVTMTEKNARVLGLKN